MPVTIDGQTYYRTAEVYRMIEFKVEGDCYYARVTNMKWSKFPREWAKLQE